MIGYLSGAAPGTHASNAAAFRKALSEIGYDKGLNLTIEYRWAEGRYNQLPTMAADLVSRKVDVITASGGDLAAREAKNATSAIPVVFTAGRDPVGSGLVASLGRPVGNLTGVSFLVVELHPKRLELPVELVPQAEVITLLVNPNSPPTGRVTRDIEEAAHTKEAPLHILKAGTDAEIDAVFASLVQLQVDALIVAADRRQFPAAGGLISYGSHLTSVYRQVGDYVGKTLKGANPQTCRFSDPRHSNWSSMRGPPGRSG
jgi:putative ABC transport system substrate-binding protein